jgi:hypothetical protein
MQRKQAMTKILSLLMTNLVLVVYVITLKVATANDDIENGFKILGFFFQLCGIAALGSNSKRGILILFTWTCVNCTFNTYYLALSFSDPGKMILLITSTTFAYIQSAAVGVYLLIGIEERAIIVDEVDIPRDDLPMYILKNPNDPPEYTSTV